jgi:hypothetical protein
MSWFGRQKVDLHEQEYRASGNAGSWHGRHKPDGGVGTEHPAPQKEWFGRSAPSRTTKAGPHEVGNPTWYGRKYGQMEHDIRAETGKMPMGYRDDTTQRYYGKSKTDLEHEGSRSLATGVLHIVNVSSQGHGDPKQVPYRTAEKVCLPMACEVLALCRMSRFYSESVYSPVARAR